MRDEDVWFNENEYPDDEDIAEFGDDASVDYDPLTIGYLGDVRPRFWTAGRIALLTVVLLLLGALLLSLLRLF